MNMLASSHCWIVVTGHYLVILGSRLASIVSTSRQDYTYAPVIRSQNRWANTSTKKICLQPVSRCWCSSHHPTGPTAASLYLANDIVHSRGHCLGLRRRLRFARGRFRAVRSMRSFLAVLIYMHIHIHIYIYMCMYIHTCIYTHIYMYMYMYK